MIKFVTIGAYGFTGVTFLAALQRANVDTFCDIRWRRGVRGAEYAFANHHRLAKTLAAAGIRYLHFRDLAPDPALRKRQDKIDQAAGIARRERIRLGDFFHQAYHDQVLVDFDSRRFIRDLGEGVSVAALFCVEREPSACHRSLLAERLRQDLGVAIAHLTPGPGAPG